MNVKLSQLLSNTFITKKIIVAVKNSNKQNIKKKKLKKPINKNFRKKQITKGSIIYNQLKKLIKNSKMFTQRFKTNKKSNVPEKKREHYL